jgi:hypothetical protein
MSLVIYILTPFTVASTLSLFQGFRVIQTHDGAVSHPWPPAQ